MDTDGQIHHVVAAGQLEYSFYPSLLLRDLEVPLIAHGLSEQQVQWSLAFLRAATQRSNRKRLLGVGVS